MRGANGRKRGDNDRKDGVEIDINECARRCAKGQGRQEGAEKSRGTVGAQRFRRGTKVQDGGPEERREARRALRARNYIAGSGEEGLCERPEVRCGAGMGGRDAGPGRGHGDGGCCTCFRGSCRDSSGCWAAARVSAPPQSLPPRCSLAPFHPHPEIPARRGASRRRPPSGPV